jgi:hypothetical protein
MLYRRFTPCCDDRAGRIPPNAPSPTKAAGSLPQRSCSLGNSLGLGRLGAVLLAAVNREPVERTEAPAAR